MKPRALVRVFNLVLCFDSDKPDTELEQETLLLLEQINKVLSEKLTGPIPQLQFEDLKKKIKIGVKVYRDRDHVDEE